VETTNEFEVIGVVRDAKYASVRDAAPPTMYWPFSQARPTSVVFEVRTAIESGPMMVPIREAVRQLYPNLPLTNVSTQVERIEQRFVQEKAFAQAYTLFGGMALVLASIGLFGLMSYSVGQRVNEIGIRMAIGAESRQIQGLVVRESMVLVFVGIATGLVGAVAARQFVASLLFGVAASDSATIAFATLLMILVSAVAVYVPARRAARVDPLVALRYE
jgi:ABC-type antimicrobial peptide transport system permease subunit